MWMLIAFLATLTAPVPSAYVHPMEVHIEYVSDAEHRPTALALASFTIKAVQQHPGFSLEAPDLWAGPGRYEVHISLVIEGEPNGPHRVGIAWQVWLRDSNSIRRRIWVSGLDQAHGTHDNIIHEAGVRVDHGIAAILDGATKMDNDWLTYIKKFYGKNSFDL